MEGSDVVSLASTHVGETYVLGAPVPLANSNWHGPWDCSKFASWLVYQAYGILYGCGGVMDPEKAHPYSGLWASDAGDPAIGIAVSVDDAVATPGAFLVRLPGIEGSIVVGHVALSIGDGSVYEAAGAKLGVRIGPVAGRRWDLGVCIPHVTYRKAPVAVPAYAEPYVLRSVSPALYDDHVVELQEALKARDFDPGQIDGQFGPTTAAAVAAFQLSQGLINDGEVGSETGSALGLPFWPSPPAAPPTPAAPVAPGPAPAPPQVPTGPFGAIVDPSTVFATIRDEYRRLFSACIGQDPNGQASELARRIAANRGRYQGLVAGYAGQRCSGMPWFFVALIHAMEQSGDVGRFGTHLYNGDPLSLPTKHFPPGLPDPNGTNFTWEESARGALAYEHLDTETDWSLERMLYRLELYNGFGYRRMSRATPYLWSYSNLYVKGKFTETLGPDGNYHTGYDENLPSKQAGAAVLLKQLVALKVVDI